MPPDEARRIAGHAEQHTPCEDCGAAPGDPCTRPGPGRAVHKSRFIAAAIALKHEAKAARRTPEEQAELAAVLASLPRIPRAEIEASRTPGGGYSFTRERLAAWGVPWPPPAGRRRALLRGEGSGAVSDAARASPGRRSSGSITASGLARDVVGEHPALAGGLPVHREPGVPESQRPVPLPLAGIRWVGTRRRSRARGNLGRAELSGKLGSW